MPELSRLDPTEARRLCAENYANGLGYYRKGAVANTWRTTTTLHGPVAGSASEPYQASAGPRDDGSFWARCTCPAARRQSLCKHAAALLIAWAERPEAFAPRAEPETVAEGAPKLESTAKRARGPKPDRRALLAAGLEKAEALLVDLCARGLLSVAAEQVEMVGSLAETLEAHKLRRLARQVAEIHRAADAAVREEGAAFDERAWARLLADTWFVLSATKRALEKEVGADRSELEELVGKTWLEKDLRRVENLRLLELGYQTAVLPSGFRVDTSFLLNLADGSLYTEKQITPLKLKDAPRKRSYPLPLRVASAGVYPGFPPLRLKLIQFSEELEVGDAWPQAAELAETSLADLRRRLSEATASLVAPQEVYSLFRPARVLAEREAVYLLDGEGKALRVGGGGRAALCGLREALTRGPVGALFCRVRFAEEGLVAEPLSTIYAR